MGNSTVLSITNIYIKIPYGTVTKKGKPITRQQMVPIAAIAATFEKQASESEIFLPETELPATFKNAYLLISNCVDKRCRHCIRQTMADRGILPYG